MNCRWIELVYIIVYLLDLEYENRIILIKDNPIHLYNRKTKSIVFSYVIPSYFIQIINQIEKVDLR